MAKNLPLTLAFLNKKPLAAGRELASMDAKDAAVFLDTIPARIAAPTLAAMGAWSASRVLSKMSETSAATILGIIDYMHAAAILRNFTVSDRKKVFSDLPKKLRRDFETSLAYPDSTVGANMTTAFMVLSEQHIVDDAIDLMQHPATISHEVILIVDADRKLAGAVTAASLLRHAGNTELGRIMDSEIESLSARARLSTIDAVPGWSHYTALPVVSRQKHVIGLLLRKAVTDVHRRHKPSGPRPTPSIPISMFDAFTASAVGLTQALIGTETSVVAKAKGRG